MFNYAPTVNDDMGQILGQYNLQRAQAIAGGIGTAGSDIGQAIQRYGEYHRLQQQAQGSIAMAKGLEDKVDANGNVTQKGILPAGFASSLMSLPADQQIGAANILPAMVGSAVMGQYRAGMLNFDQAKLGIMQGRADAASSSAAAKTQGVMPWNATPAPGGLGATTSQ